MATDNNIVKTVSTKTSINISSAIKTCISLESTRAVFTGTRLQVDSERKEQN